MKMVLYKVTRLMGTSKAGNPFDICSVGLINPFEDSEKMETTQSGHNSVKLGGEAAEFNVDRVVYDQCQKMLAGQGAVEVTVNMGQRVDNRTSKMEMVIRGVSLYKAAPALKVG